MDESRVAVSLAVERVRALLLAAVFGTVAVCASGPCVLAADVRSGLELDGTPTHSKAGHLPAPPVIVIGFVGGYVSHDNAVHSVVQVAAHLRQDYPSGVYIAVYENHRREEAHREILRLLDTNQDGKLSDGEKKVARIVIYGHSWGACESVALSQELGGEGIPVLLTIQVDSVSKRGENDGLIPANVRQAVNFYQEDGFLHGRSEIHAADPERTQILANDRFDYREHHVECPAYPWYARVFMKAHTEIECDPNVWNRVESLIRQKLPGPGENTAAQ
jgi:hypothetical protein